MKYICKIDEVRTISPELYCIAKKQEIKQKLITQFMKQECISDETREEFKQYIKAERAKDEKKYMTAVREKFLEMFYKNVEKKKDSDVRSHFEDNF